VAADFISNPCTVLPVAGTQLVTLNRGIRNECNQKIAAVALIVAGVLGLVYGSFSYTKETHQAKLGSIQL
jgi:hypothetical protein